MKRCFNKECCKQCRYVKVKGTMTIWPVQKLTHRTTQKHVQHHDATESNNGVKHNISVYSEININL